MAGDARLSAVCARVALGCVLAAIGRVKSLRGDYLTACFEMQDLIVRAGYA
jgi:hypothetical protein